MVWTSLKTYTFKIKFFFINSKLSINKTFSSESRLCGWHTFWPVQKRLLSTGMVHFWTVTKISFDYGNGTLLDQYKNKCGLRDWYTFGPVQKRLFSTGMVHFWTSTKTSDDYGIGTLLNRYKKESWLREWNTFGPGRQRVLTTGTAHFWTSVIGCSTSLDWASEKLGHVWVGPFLKK